MISGFHWNGQIGLYFWTVCHVNEPLESSDLLHIPPHFSVSYPQHSGWQILFKSPGKQKWEFSVELWVCPDWGPFLSLTSSAIVPVFCIWSASERVPGYLQHDGRNLLQLSKKALNCSQVVQEPLPCSYFIWHIDYLLDYVYFLALNAVLFVWCAS